VKKRHLPNPERRFAEQVLVRFRFRQSLLASATVRDVRLQIPRLGVVQQAVQEIEQ
jgi:hypothetical protein